MFTNQILWYTFDQYICIVLDSNSIIWSTDSYISLVCGTFSTTHKLLSLFNVHKTSDTYDLLSQPTFSPKIFQCPIFPNPNLSRPLTVQGFIQIIKVKKDFLIVVHHLYQRNVFGRIIHLQSCEYQTMTLSH